MKKTDITRMHKNDNLDIALANGYTVSVHALDNDEFNIEIVHKKSIRKTRVLTDTPIAPTKPFNADQVKWLVEHIENAVNDFEVGMFYMNAYAYTPKTNGKGKANPSQTPKKNESKPTKGKGNINNALKKDLDKLAGTGDNSAAHKVMCKHGLTNFKSPEYEAVWKGYWWTIR